MVYQEFCISDAVGSLYSAMKWVDLENLPMIDRITDLPEQTDRPVTKSTAICNHGLEQT